MPLTTVCQVCTSDSTSSPQARPSGVPGLRLPTSSAICWPSASHSSSAVTMPSLVGLRTIQDSRMRSVRTRLSRERIRHLSFAAAAQARAGEQQHRHRCPHDALRTPTHAPNADVASRARNATPAMRCRFAMTQAECSSRSGSGRDGREPDDSGPYLSQAPKLKMKIAFIFTYFDANVGYPKLTPAPRLPGLTHEDHKINSIA